MEVWCKAFLRYRFGSPSGSSRTVHILSIRLFYGYTFTNLRSCIRYASFCALIYSLSSIVFVLDLASFVAPLSVLRLWCSTGLFIITHFWDFLLCSLRPSTRHTHLLLRRRWRTVSPWFCSYLSNFLAAGLYQYCLKGNAVEIALVHAHRSRTKLRRHH